MTTAQRKDDRYENASKRLRRTLGEGKVFDEANAWALKLCKQAEQCDWSRQNRFEKGWAGASAAAEKLAKHLQLGDCASMQRICDAEKQSGVSLKSDQPIDEALTKVLLALSDQPAPRGRPRNICGPLEVGFRYRAGLGGRKRSTLPSRPIALAIALAHGFRTINACVEEGKSSVVEPFTPLRSGGTPCYDAAVQFANVVFKEKTTEVAVKKWIARHKGYIKYQGFGSKDNKPEK